MANQTKMIIITSDEDIIRRFSLNKATNTHIIDLDNNNQLISTTQDNDNTIHLDFLSQLSEHNSNHDRIYKRALDSSDHNRSKPVKTPKKSDDFICAVCGDHAVGFNYDVLSCASCKIFFRRNAHLDLGKLKCSTGQGQCSVAHKMRRSCKRCRLDRCFAMGMRKDSIVSEEEKQRRKKRLEENRNMTSKRLSNLESISHTFEEINHISMDPNGNDIIDLHENINSNPMNDTSLEMLSIEDWITIENIRSLFLSIVHDDNTNNFSVDISNRVSALITWSQFVQKSALRFINFFRHINEFEDLHADDRFILIKYNLFPLFPIYRCFNYKPINDSCSHGEHEEAIKHRRFFMLCGAPNGIRDTFVDLVLSLVELTKQDPTILSLLSTIFIFSRGLSMNENEPLLKDSLAVNRAQSHYTKILWNYLVGKCGEMEACRYFTHLLNMIFRIQSVAKRIREFFRVQYMTSDAMDRMAPLMQSALHIC